MSIAADLAALVTGFGSSAVLIGDVEGRGLLDEEDGPVEDESGREVLQRRVVLTVRRADFPALAPHVTVRVDSTDFRAGDVVLSADGLIALVPLKRVSRAARV
ncbi:MAG: hypothetical protein ABR551_14305 [Gemmatimonadales bacterium]